MVQTQHLDGRQPGIRENDGEYNESFVFPAEGRVAAEKNRPLTLQQPAAAAARVPGAPMDREKGGGGARQTDERGHYHTGMLAVVKMDAGLLSRIAWLSAIAYFAVNNIRPLMEKDLTFSIVVMKWMWLRVQHPSSEGPGDAGATWRAVPPTRGGRSRICQERAEK